MSLLQDTNFTEFDGTRVTGRSPPATRVLGREMTDPQHSMASAAFAKFKNEVKLSIAPQTQKRVVLEDGSVMMMSSGYGDDRVIIWPAGGEEDDANEPRGIGIVFTDLAGEPIPEWSYEDADGNAFPQPLILKHHKSDTAEPGTWTVARVKKLLGGQRLWTNETRTQWLSVFCAADELQMGSFSVDMSATRTPELALINRDWTALENDRIAIGGSNGQESYGSYGQYLFQRNETVRLMSVSSKYPAFLTKTPGHLYQHVLMYVRVGDDWGFQLQRAEAAKVSGLQKFGAVLEPEHYLSTVIPITTPGGIEPAPQSLSVHPDGKRAMSMAWPLVTPSLDARYITFEIGETATATGHTHALPAFAKPVGTGSLSWSGTNNSVITWGVQPGHNSPSVKTAIQTLTRTASGTAQGTLDSTCLNRLYYDLAGNTVTESVTESATSSLDVSVDDTVCLYFYPGWGQDGSHATNSESATSNGTYSSTTTLNLNGATFAAGTETSSSSQTYNRNATHSLQQGTQTMTFTGALSKTSRKVIHYDSVNNVLVYYELIESATVTGTLTKPATETLTTAMTKDFMTPTATASIKVARSDGGGFATVFEYPVAVEASVNNVGLGTPRYVGFDAWDIDFGSMLLGNIFPADSSNEASGTTRENYLGSGFGGSMATTNPLQHMTFKSAHDPKTLAIVMSLTFNRQAFDGGENQSWIWAADEQSVRNLTDILTFEDAGAKPMVGEANAFNTLVSI